MLAEAKKSRTYNIILSNDSKEYLQIDKNDPVALLTSNSNDMELYSIHHGSVLDAETYPVDSNYSINFKDFVLTSLDCQNWTNDLHTFEINSILASMESNKSKGLELKVNDTLGMNATESQGVVEQDSVDTLVLAREESRKSFLNLGRQ